MLVWCRSADQIDAVIGLLHLSLEAQTIPAHGREGERVAHPFTPAQKTPRDVQRLRPPLDAVYRLVGVDVTYLVLDKEVPARLADLSLPRAADTKLSPGMLHHSARLGSERCATLKRSPEVSPPGLQAGDELAHQVGSGFNILRHLGERA
jgi:hypothetical protein